MSDQIGWVKDNEMNELKVENKVVDDVCITEEEIRSIFLKFKEFVLERNILECK